MRKLSVKWVPKCLKAKQKRQQCQSSVELLEFVRRDPNYFLLRLVTMDETRLYHSDPETKQQSVEWRHSGSPRLAPQKMRVQKSAEKVLASILFGDQDSILLIDYLPKFQTINTEYYSSLLVQLKDILKKKRRGKITNGVLFFHDNARLTGHLQNRINRPTWASILLITHPILRILSRRTTNCALD